MYRINYRIYKGVIFGNQKLYKQGSFVSQVNYNVGDLVYVTKEDSSVEVTQTIKTTRP